MIIMLVLVLFAADVVQAAPAALLMQLDGQTAPAEMPCHMQQADQQHDQQADAGPGKCHACFACVNLVSAPAGLLVIAPFRPALVAHPQSDYQTCLSAPALRPPIFA